MKNITNLLFEANMLKSIPRSGYQFLGNGKESVAEHSFCTAFIAFVMSQMDPRADGARLVNMCLIHDLPEALIGDLNYVQKKYVVADEKAAVTDSIQGLPFGAALADLLDEFNSGQTHEARLARDADQLAFVLELKSLLDRGFGAAEKWLPHVIDRLQTETGKQMAESIMNSEWDEWWLNNYVDRSDINQ